MNDELESILTEGLHQRAGQADTRVRGFGEVRRRVRRHRQRQMAAGLLPAVAGIGWIVTRPAAHAPLSPGGAGGCDTTLSPTTTWRDGSPGSSTTPGMPGAGLETTTTYYGQEAPSTTVYGASVTQTTWYIQADGQPTGTVVVPGTADDTSTTIACEEPTTLPPSTGPSEADASTTTGTHRIDGTTTVFDPATSTTVPIESTTTSIG